ncbi:MAG: hypothetical protein ACR2ND_12720 [Solirubrobacteraceae bacterium]
MPIAITLYNSVLALHIAAVLAAFGVVLAYPVMYSVALRLEPRAMPAIHRIQDHVGRYVITPGMVVVLAAGIYLAADKSQFKELYVQWGFAAIVVLGALVGAYFAPRERRLAELAERDVTAAGDGEVAWGADYGALRHQVASVNLLAIVIVLSTIFVMVVKP